MYTVIAAIVLLYSRVHRSECKRRTHLEQIFVSYIQSREFKDTMLGGVHCTNRRAGASSLCIPLLHVYCNSGHSTPMLEGAQVGVQKTNATCNVLGGGGNVLLWVQTTNTLGTNFCQWKSLMPCLVACIIRTAWQQPPHWSSTYLDDIMPKVGGACAPLSVHYERAWNKLLPVA